MKSPFNNWFQYHGTCSRELLTPFPPHDLHLAHPPPASPAHPPAQPRGVTSLRPRLGPCPPRLLPRARPGGPALAPALCLTHSAPAVGEVTAPTSPLPAPTAPAPTSPLPAPTARSRHHLALNRPRGPASPPRPPCRTPPHPSADYLAPVPASLRLSLPRPPCPCPSANSRRPTLPLPRPSSPLPPVCRVTSP